MPRIAHCMWAEFVWAAWFRVYYGLAAKAWERQSDLLQCQNRHIAALECMILLEMRSSLYV